jgi:3,4-dihydroxy 2-butanone 4-phosphate synthase/GTP cyclohydrolase II
VLAGDCVTPDSINFMAKHGRGLICLALDSARVRTLGLPPMARHNASRHSTAFTVSIEAREGITTGISAADRARTIQVAIDPAKGATDIVSPGHVFPLEAREGGVLVRAGHTEAAVDLARLAGHAPAGVICEIMSEDGTMARLPELLKFAATHGLKTGSIADLIAYRRRSERLVERLVESRIETTRGPFRCVVYGTTHQYAEHIVLIKGDITPDVPVLVRMHALDVLTDVLGDKGLNRAGILDKALDLLAEAPTGVLVLLREPQRTAVSERLRMAQNAETSTPALRDYGIGAQILLDLGVKSMHLLTNAPRSIVGLEGYGLEVLGYQPVIPEA